MELKIQNGDYILNGSGGAETVAGSAELIQRVLYKLTARREGFPFIPTLGSDLYQLERTAPNARDSAAEQYVRQALSDEADLELTGITLTDAGEGLYDLKVCLTYSGQGLELTLTVQ